MTDGIVEYLTDTAECPYCGKHQVTQIVIETFGTLKRVEACGNPRTEKWGLACTYMAMFPMDQEIAG